MKANGARSNSISTKISYSKLKNMIYNTFLVYEITQYEYFLMRKKNRPPNYKCLPTLDIWIAANILFSEVENIMR